MTVPTEQEVNEPLDRCTCGDAELPYPGSYEEGVKYGIEWMRGDGDDPFGDDE